MKKLRSATMTKSLQACRPMMSHVLWPAVFALACVLFSDSTARAVDPVATGDVYSGPTYDAVVSGQTLTWRHYAKWERYATTSNGFGWYMLVWTDAGNYVYVVIPYRDEDGTLVTWFVKYEYYDVGNPLNQNFWERREFGWVELPGSFTGGRWGFWATIDVYVDPAGPPQLANPVVWSYVAITGPGL
jgi:hypothetical protein